MGKMKERNTQLKAALGMIAPKERIVESLNLPKEDTVNRQGHKAYSVADELRLIGMLNTLKLQPQFYRSENEQMTELRELIYKIGTKDPYFLAQCIAWSRTQGEGMRTINHLAAALAAPFFAGQTWAKAFYGLYDKKLKRGGCIFRADDMSEIKDAFYALGAKGLTSGMRKGFASVIENLDTYAMAKYKNSIIDIANLARPSSRNSKAEVTIEGKTLKTLDAIMNGITVSADTWEVAQSEAGQEVAKAVREGKITKSEAQTILAEAKADNWEGLLRDGRLGILAALRNIRNMLNNPREDMIDMWCKLITDKNKVAKALILPIHFDLAYQVVKDEFGSNRFSGRVKDALQKAYVNAIPNLAAVMPGKTCIIVDCSGSMGGYGISVNGKPTQYNYWDTNKDSTNSCAYKASLIAATFAQATGADVIQFGTRANYKAYDRNKYVFDLADDLRDASHGGTSPHTAFDLMTSLRKVYDRIIFISDNEVNSRNLTSDSYKRYIQNVCSPYIYAIDLAAYGTTPLKNEGKLQMFYGYGPEMYDAVAQNEFNAQAQLEKIKSYVIDPTYKKVA